MTPTEPFHEWFERVRAADQDASATHGRVLGPHLTRVVEARLSENRLGRLGRLVDPLDICQSTFGEFFAQVTSGRLAVDSEQHLRALLVSIARNKIRDEVRRHRAGRRDFRRVVHVRPNDELHAVAGSDPSPSTVVAGHELYNAVLSRLSGPERKLLEDRTLGRDWSAIAAELGDTPEVLRKKLSRAIRRVHRQLVAAGVLPPEVTGRPPQRSDAPRQPESTDDSSPTNNSRSADTSSGESAV